MNQKRNNAMKSSSLKAVIETAFKAKIKRPIIIWGAAGVGKSSVVAEAAQSLHIPLIDLRLSQIEPVDLRGIPTVDKKGYTDFARSKLLPSEEIHGPEGILFLDEITSGDLSMQAAGYQLINDRKLGDHCLPDGWLIIAASNREEDRGIVNRMVAPLANRFTHVQYDLDLKDWSIWAASAGVHPLVIGFLNFRPNYLHAFNPDRGAEMAFGSPRSWHSASDWIWLNLSPEDELELILGSVGTEAGTEFTGYRRVASELPDISDIEAAPSTTPVPSEVATMYALSSVLAFRIDASNNIAFCEYMARLAPEFTTIFMDMVKGKDVALLNNKPAINWMTEHGNALFGLAA
jgi:hypothetical protein